MTEAEWQSCADPREMLAFLAGRPVHELVQCYPGDRLSDRKLRQFHIAWSRYYTFPDAEQRLQAIEQRLQAIEMDEKYADGEVTFEQVAAAWAFMGGQAMYTTGWEDAVEAASISAVDVGWYESQVERCDRVKASFLRDIFGNPFRPVSFDPSWRRWNGGVAVALAKQMYDSRDFSTAPLPADMLEDAGCTEPQVLDHLRGPGPHVRGCWVVDLILGKS
jgi:hypothetical protein